MYEKTQKRSVRDMVFMAILIALILIMTFTGIAYIPIAGPLKLTIITLPVAIGAVMLGPVAGLILGGVFGISSLLTCILGIDAFGVLLFGINPLFTIILCVVPRLLSGWLTGMIFYGLRRHNAVAVPVTCTAAALTNTLFFMTALWALFGKEIAQNPDIIAMLGGTLNGFFALVAALAGVNALLEAAAGLVLGSAICFALQKVRSRI